MRLDNNKLKRLVVGGGYSTKAHKVNGHAIDVVWKESAGFDCALIDMEYMSSGGVGKDEWIFYKAKIGNVYWRFEYVHVKNTVKRNVKRGEKLFDFYPNYFTHLRVRNERLTPQKWLQYLDPAITIGVISGVYDYTKDNKNGKELPNTLPIKSYEMVTLQKPIRVQVTLKDQNLLVRPEPSDALKEVGALRPQEVISVSKVAKGKKVNGVDTWYFVELPTVQGYVSGAFIKELSTDISNLEAQINTLAKKVNDLEGEVNYFSTQAEQLQQALVSKNTEISDKIEIIEQAQIREASLREVVRRLEADLEDAQTNTFVKFFRNIFEFIKKPKK